MPYTPDNIAELDLLMLYPLSTTQEGIKIHKTAHPGMISAAKRLHERGFTTQADGGYLTARGSKAAEHTQSLYSLLNVQSEVPSEVQS